MASSFTKSARDSVKYVSLGQLPAVGAFVPLGAHALEHVDVRDDRGVLVRAARIERVEQPHVSAGPRQLRSLPRGMIARSALVTTM